MLTKKERPPFRQIGWRETVALPDLGIPSINAKIDTGARTSALHAIIGRQFDRDGQDWIEFAVPLSGTNEPLACTAPLVGKRNVKNTSGLTETRYAIATTLVLGSRHWHIDVTLADRERMRFDLILGRTAIRGRRLCVNPGRSYLADPPILADR